MPSKPTIGAAVHTPLGKGVVRAIRNGGRLLVEVNGRAVLFDATAIAEPVVTKTARRTPPPPEFSPVRSSAASSHTRGHEVDLHGLTVEEALTCAEQAINDALLDDRLELCLIHGQSGGRIRAALHRRLREISSVRGFHLDPRNAGVTVVTF